ncbi:MAG: GNAT family N-acetyltransferase [Janthinobacterium lividum]
MSEDDWPDVRRIYAEGIATGIATFQTEVPEYDIWDRGHLTACRLVAETDDRILGWVALGAYSSRPAYRGVAEISIYIASDARGQGIGRALLEQMTTESEARGFWTLVAGIFAVNGASRSLHAKAGFREVGFREKVGELNGAWHDVVIMERRSKTVGA